MRRIAFKRSLLSYKAILAGALTIVAVEQVARFLSRPWMTAQTDGIEEKLREVAASTTPPTVSVAEYTQNLMLPVIVVSLSISIAAYFFGGYVVGRVSNRNWILNAILAFTLVIGGTFVLFGNGFQEQPIYFVPIAAVGVLITVLGCMLGVKLSTGRA